MRSFDFLIFATTDPVPASVPSNPLPDPPSIPPCCPSCAAAFAARLSAQIALLDGDSSSEAALMRETLLGVLTGLTCWPLTDQP